MNPRAARSATLAAVVAAGLLAALVPLQQRIDAALGGLRAEEEALLLRSGGLLRRLSLGYDALLANLYWTRTVQYYGGKLRDRDPHFELLEPLLNLTADLDPQLDLVYRFGAIFLAEPPPRGAGRPRAAVAFVRRGIAAHPRDWRMWGDLGFTYYWYLKEYDRAAEAYLEGSRLPGAPPWMRAMAARIAAEGGSRRVSRFLWTQLYESTTDPAIRENARRNLTQLRIDDDLEHLNELLEEFARRAGRRAANLRELVAAGLLPGVPVDPAGARYVIGADGAAQLDPQSPVHEALDVRRPPRP